jgi:hypothetical protein
MVEEFGQDEAVRLFHLGTRNRDLMLEAIGKLGIAEEVDLHLTGTRVVFASEEERETYVAELQHAEKLSLSFEGRLVERNELCEVCNTPVLN